MLDAISLPRWSTFVVRGLLAVCMGIIAFAMPAITLMALTLLFGVFAGADGLIALTNVARGSSEHKAWLALQGVVGIAAAVVTFMMPGMTSIVLLYVIAAWAFARGVFLLSGWWSARTHMDNAWVFALDGLVSLAFGVLLVASPIAGALALAFILGTYGILIGVTLVAVGLTLRGHLGAARLP